MSGVVPDKLLCFNVKKLFFILLSILTVWSFAVYFSRDEVFADHPIIYWVTDNNPARALQISTFHQWLEDNGYPKIEVRLDTSNSDVTKKIIQSVSGVGGDIMDLPSAQISFFQQAGLLEDVTDYAREMGFSTDTTFAALESDLTANGRQYAYPANISVDGVIVNLDAFRRVGIEPPPYSWTVEEFEALGREYVERANRGLSRRVNFFMASFNRAILYRSMGLANYNETMTLCTLNDERYIKALELVHKWTYQDRILPSAADTASMATDTGYGGASLQLLATGNYAMMPIGRHAIIQFRQFRNPVNLKVVHYPYIEFENTTMQTRAAVMYAGGAHKEEAAYFMKFLASKEYNDLIVDDGDGLPPSPLAVHTEEYERPSSWPMEHQFHEPYARMAENTAITSSFSPFLPTSLAARIEQDGYSAFMANLLSAEVVAANVENRTNDEIRRTVNASPELKEMWEQQMEIQQKIDELKERGEPIPLEWISNPFHRAYYRSIGMILEPEEEN